MLKILSRIFMAIGGFVIFATVAFFFLMHQSWFYSIVVHGPPPFDMFGSGPVLMTILIVASCLALGFLVAGLVFAKVGR